MPSASHAFPTALLSSCRAAGLLAAHHTGTGVVTEGQSLQGSAGFSSLLMAAAPNRVASEEDALSCLRGGGTREAETGGNGQKEGRWSNMATRLPLLPPPLPLRCTPSHVRRRLPPAHQHVQPQCNCGFVLGCCPMKSMPHSGAAAAVRGGWAAAHTKRGTGPHRPVVAAAEKVPQANPAFMRLGHPQNSDANKLIAAPRRSTAAACRRPTDGRMLPGQVRTCSPPPLPQWAHTAPLSSLRSTSSFRLASRPILEGGFCLPFPSASRVPSPPPDPLRPRARSQALRFSSATSLNPHASAEVAAATSRALPRPPLAAARPPPLVTACRRRQPWTCPLSTRPSLRPSTSPIPRWRPWQTALP